VKTTPAAWLQRAWPLRQAYRLAAQCRW